MLNAKEIERKFDEIEQKIKTDINKLETIRKLTNQLLYQISNGNREEARKILEKIKKLNEQL